MGDPRIRGASYVYRGVFYSDFDYEHSLAVERFSQIKEKIGIPLDTRDRDARERLGRLEELGGPRAPLGNRELTLGELQQIIEVGEEYQRTRPSA